MKKSYRRVLTVAGSDSGGGAGIQADLKTFSALGCYGMTAITALTAQNTTGVFDIHPVPPSFAARQMEAVLGDIGADAVKIGMLYSPELVEAVAAQLKKHAVQRIVLDPVMIAQSGDRLVKDDAVDAIRTLLMPLATVVTPNLPEAAVLLARPVERLEHMAAAARELAACGCRSVLVKGGHLSVADSCDLLYLREGDRVVELPGKRVDTVNNHGTGCTLSSAIAAHLAHGLDIEAAVRQAKSYIGAAIAAGAEYRLGRGNGPVHHFHHFWQ
jgi:hydroxymethylpyrimidine/phosphomethylpyrimidine kinase